MASLDPRKAEQALKKKGFTMETGKDHLYFRLNVDGKDTSIQTKISHNSADIGNGLIKKMSNQLRIDKNFFIDFVSCEKSQQDYINELVGKAILSKAEVKEYFLFSLLNFLLIPALSLYFHAPIFRLRRRGR
jgi:predicted RNA binding protein YcfA (HicA-like mRNA interferase family)